MFHITPAVGPFATVRIAFRDARLVRVKRGFGETSGSDSSQLLLIEIADRDAQPINLRQRDLAPTERLGDAAALLKKPIVVSIGVEQAFLNRRSVVALDTPEAAGRTADQDAFGSEHRALGVDANSSARRTAWVQPPHIVEHETNQVWGAARKASAPRSIQPLSAVR